MNRWVRMAVWVATAAAGCAGPSADIDLPAAAGPIGFDGLAVVLPAVITEDGLVDPTALAVHLPRLNRQLALLAQPWPEEVARPDGNNDARLAWLYNARLAWSLRIVARELRPIDGPDGLFGLPDTIDARTFLETSVPLNGGRTTLGGIDCELAAYDDFRIAACAPGVTDFFGPPVRAPFSAETVKSLLNERFAAYGRDPGRIVIDHDRKLLRPPPALAQFADRLTSDRPGTGKPSLATALAGHLDARGRDRMEDALGYRVVVRVSPAGIRATKPRQPTLR